jgi:hypothetical protein
MLLCNRFEKTCGGVEVLNVSSGQEFTKAVMQTVLPLKTMSRAEKLRIMEEIWVDLTEDDETFESPAWHKEALEEAKHAVEDGTATFSDWEDAKKRILVKTQRKA